MKYKALILAVVWLLLTSVAQATTVTDSFPTIVNPLTTPNWSTTAGGLKVTAAGIAKGTGVSPQDNLSSWATTSHTFLANQTSAATVSNLGSFDWPGVTVHITGTGTTCSGYVLYVRPEALAASLYKLATSCTIGTGSTDLLAAYTITSVTGSHTVELDISGTTLTSKYDGATLGTVTDSTYTTGQPGLAYEFGNSDASQVNSYTATDASGGGQRPSQFFLGLILPIAWIMYRRKKFVK